ncbi:unnamed protein product [Aphanomyces euteiches]
MRTHWALLLIAAVVARQPQPDRCTAILVGPKASLTGSPMTTQTNDCADCDFRLVKVPAMQHPPNSQRSIILANQPYPRYVGEERGPVYNRSNLDKGLYNWTNTEAIGSIPQVEQTYGYIEGVHGIMNEHQLGFGESTCGARLWTKPISEGGKALLDITELSRIALERTKTAREAILLMGKLAEQYGYYGASWDDPAEAIKEAGEALTVTDPKEAWMFHILPDDTGASAVWFSQRVPDNHVTAVANQFVIRTVNLTDTDNFLGSTNMHDVAKRNGFWDGRSDFDFTHAFAPRYDNAYGMTRRVWRVFNLVNPGLILNPDTDNLATDYPFSVEATQPLAPQDLMRIQRDHYEGTAFDLTQGLAAGPYGDPNRYNVGSAAAHSSGFFERSISIYKATYSYVTVASPTNENHGLIWFGPYAPSETTYVPIYTKINTAPTRTGHGSLRQFDMDTAFWLYALVGNYAARYYKFAQPLVTSTQNTLETKAILDQTAIQTKAQSISDSQGADALALYLTNVCESFATDAHNGFKALFASLVTQFHDGYIMSNFTSAEMGVQAMGYPEWWLNAVGFYKKSDTTSIGAAIGYVVLVLVATALGFFVGQRYAHPKGYAALH